MFRNAVMTTMLGALALVASPLTTEVSAHTGHHHAHAPAKRHAKKAKHHRAHKTKHHHMTPGMKM